jgi:geranylgeranyl pyrophosphate synthase
VNDRTEAAIGDWRQRIDLELSHVADVGDHLPTQLREAIHYSLTGEGKRFRGLLLMAVFHALQERRGGWGAANGTDASALAAAVEVVHAYSLVHDDLPCMDDDNLRRGRPTTHRAFDVSTATIAGVAMVPLAVQQTVLGARRLGLDAQTSHRLVSVLMRASGASGMVGGQLMDLEGEERPLSANQLESVHRAKTGALITAAFTMGGIAARGDESSIQALTVAGESLGLAFQIADDVLDATSSSETLGKTAGRDAALSKSTYVSALGVDAARRRGESLVTEAMRGLEAAGLRTDPLDRLAHFVAARRS